MLLKENETLINLSLFFSITEVLPTQFHFHIIHIYIELEPWNKGLESLSDELPIFISESKSGSERLSAAAKKEKLARIVEMFKPAKTTQKSFAWDCVVSDDSKKDEKK